MTIRGWTVPSAHCARWGSPLRCILAIVQIVVLVDIGAATASDHVAILMSKDIQPFRLAKSGFTDVCKRSNTTYDLKGTDGDVEAIVREIRKERPALILAIGSEALAAAAALDGIPVVFSMVVRPDEILRDRSGVTGARAEIPMHAQLDVLVAIAPHVEKVGVVFDPKRSKNLIGEIETAAGRMGLQLVTAEAGSAGESLKALKQLEGSVDAWLMIPDRTTVTTQTFEYMIGSSFRHRAPVVGLSKKFVQRSALFALVLDYEDLGRQSGEMANQVIAGRSPDELPFARARSHGIVLNSTAADRMGVKIPDYIGSSAEVVE